MGRRRQNSKSIDRPSTPEKRSRPNLNPLRRGTSSKNMQTIPSPEASVVNLNSSSFHREPPSPQPHVRTPTENFQPHAEQRRADDEMNGERTLPPPIRSSSLPTNNGAQASHDQAQRQDQQSMSAPEPPAEVRAFG